MAAAGEGWPPAHKMCRHSHDHGGDQSACYTIRLLIHYSTHIDSHLIASLTSTFRTAALVAAADADGAADAAVNCDWLVRHVDFVKVCRRTTDFCFKPRTILYCGAAAVVVLCCVVLCCVVLCFVLLLWCV